MKSRIKMSIQLVKCFTFLFFIMVLLVGCTQKNLNIEPDPSFLADDIPGNLGNDFYIVAYGNMVDLEAAEKHKLTKVFTTLSNIQVIYGLYDQAFSTLDRGMACSDNLDLFMYKLKLYDRLDDKESYKILVDQMVEEQSARYPSMLFKDKMIYNYALITSIYGKQGLDQLFELLDTNISYTETGQVISYIGLAYFYQNDYENGKYYSEMALDVIPEDSDTLLNLGGYYQAQGDYETAFNYYNQVLQRYPDNADAIYRCAVAAYEQDNLDLAVDYFSKFVTLRPNDVEGWTGYYISTEDPELQKNCVDALVSIAPDDRNYAYYQLIVEQKLANPRDPYEVIMAYQEATSPFDAKWLVADFTFHYLSEVEGISLYRDLIENVTLSFSDYVDFVNNIGSLGNSVLLAQVLNQVEAAHGAENRYILEAYVSYYTSDIDSLMNASKKIIKINPQNGYGYESLADSYYFRKDYVNALSNYLLAVQYRDEPYDSSKAVIDCLILLDRIEEAEALSEQFILDYPNDAYGYVNHARIKMRMMIVESAVKHLTTAMSLSNNLNGIFEVYEELAPLKERPEFKSIAK